MGNYDIRIENQESIKKYFSIVGSHNPKHLKKYCLKTMIKSI
jgi:hypothetical protein